MKKFIVSTILKKDNKLAKRRNKDLTAFKQVITLLMTEQSIPQKFKDHSLSGNWVGYRELHLEPDFLLIYRITPSAILGERLGTHSDLFFKNRR